MRVIAVLQGHEVIERDDGSVVFDAHMAIDNDGPDGNPEHDPYHQETTSEKYQDGASLDAEHVCYGTVPPEIIKGVKGIVMGCKQRVTYHKTGRVVEGCVGDEYPAGHLGELSVAYAKALGAPSSPINGGDDDPKAITVELWPGVPGVVNGVTVPLRPFRS